MNLRLATIGDFVEPVDTWNPATKSAEKFSYIDLSALDQTDKNITSSATILGCEAPSRARQLIKCGDILVSTVRPNLNGVAAVTKEFDGATASTGFCVLRPRRDKLSSSYLFHWVRSPQFVAAMVRQATGASYPAVSDRIVRTSLIPLPPFAEQCRIAAILDKADALRRERKRSVELVESLIASSFIEMFGDERSSCFPLKHLDSVADQITDGAHFTPTYVDDGIPFLRVTDIQSKTIDWGKVKYIPEEEHDELLLRCKPEIGDVLLSKNGTIGLARYIDWQRDFSIFVSLCLIKPSRRLLSGRYLASFLRSPGAQRQLRQRAKTGTVTNLHLVDIRKVSIPVPPLETQNKWESMEAIIRSEANILTTAALASDCLFCSLQHRAFSGQL